MNELLKLIIVDLKMGHVNRHRYNITFYQEEFSNIYKLSPIYDFSNSYEKESSELSSIYYINPFINIKRDSKVLKKLSRKYPSIIDSIDILKNIRLEDALEHISLESGCVFTDNEVDFYVDRDREISKIFKKI